MCHSEKCQKHVHVIVTDGVHRHAGQAKSGHIMVNQLMLTVKYIVNLLLGVQEPRYFNRYVSPDSR